MAGRQQVGAEVVGGLEQVGEFHVLVAGDARDRRLAGDIGAGEGLDHLLAEPLLVVEHVMGNAEPRGDVARVVDVLPGAAGALAMRRFAMVVELHRHADDVIAFGGKQRRDDAKSTPPDIATTTRVSAGAFGRPRLLSAARGGGASEGASMAILPGRIAGRSVILGFLPDQASP